MPKAKLPSPLYSSVVFIYLLTTRRVLGYPINYPVGYPGNKLADNGSPNHAMPCFGRHFQSILLH